MRHRRRFLTALLAALLLAAVPPLMPQASARTGPAPQENPADPVGEVRDGDIALRYGATGRTWSTRIHERGASYVKVHFAALRLLPGDRVTVSDPARREVHTYFGDPARGANAGGSDHTEHGRPGFAALSIDGDTAVVTLHARVPRTDAARLSRLGYGARIDRYWRGFTAAEQAERSRTLSVCGTDARRDVVCYRDSHPTEFARSQAVGQQLLNGLGSCTVWRVGDTNRLLTNHHCMENEADLRASEFVFGRQCATCGGSDAPAGTKVGPGQFIKTSALNALDYTLFSVSDLAAIQRYGTLYLEPREPVAGERIYIPGHGDIKPKRLSLYEDAQGGATCKIDVVSAGVNTGYRCDTSGGNSGSPVLAAASHKVIALHHLGGCPNWGTRITLVYNEIAGLIDNTPPTGGEEYPLTVVPHEGTVAPDGVVSARVITQTVGGQVQNLTLSTEVLPPGTTVAFNPSTIPSGAESTMVINAHAQTPAGTYPIRIKAAGSTVTHTALYTLHVAAASGCQGFETTKTGSLTASQTQYQPDGRFFQTTVSGAHRACLDGPDSANFDLYLERWNGSGWTTVAQSTSPGADESLAYTGAAGYYRYRLYSSSGDGAYSLGYDAP
ncbi:S1 family peptidase [Spongiactinospora rosea]|uniref:S1 family peptidase n=1 Tax=Spongiactinospora rosea TaxID=2248750 RepID=UPI0018F7C13A|nr:serine protease [Spongiactinospora rosea]